MPKYYCDYCDTYLTHDSPSVRKTHCQGRKHRDNVRCYYQSWMEEQAQHLIDATTAAYKAGKITSNSFVNQGVTVPPPPLPMMQSQGPPMMPPPGMPPPRMAPPMWSPWPPMMGRPDQMRPPFHPPPYRQ